MGEAGPQSVEFVDAGAFHQVLEAGAGLEQASFGLGDGGGLGGVFQSKQGCSRLDPGAAGDRKGVEPAGQGAAM